MIKKVYSHKYDNGFELWYAKTTKSQFISLQLWIGCGSSYEFDSADYGICHMIEHLVFKGNKTIQLGDLDAIMYLVGGKMNAYTSKDFTVYLFSFPVAYFQSIFSILSNLFCEPSFNPDFLEKEKSIVTEELLLHEDDPFSVLFDASFLNSNSKKNNYDHPILGTLKSIQEFTKNQIEAFYVNHYEPGSMKWCIVGSLPFTVIKKTCDQSAFIRLLADASSPKKSLSRQKNKKIIRPLEVLFHSTLNEHILILYKLPICSFRDIHAYKAMNLLLGGSKDSLLYKKLHIDEHLVHDIKSFFYGVRFDSYFFIYFNPVSLKDISQIITRIYSIIDDFKDGIEDEVDFSKIQNSLEFDHFSLIEEDYDDLFYVFTPFLFEKKENILKKINYQIVFNKMKRLLASLKNNLTTTTILLPQSYESSIDKNDILNSFTRLEKNYKEIFAKSDVASCLNSPLSQDNQEEIIEKIFTDPVVVNAAVSEEVISEKRSAEKKVILQMQEKNKKRLAYQKTMQERFPFLKTKKLPAFEPMALYEKETLENSLKLIFACPKKMTQSENIVTIILSFEVNHTYDEKGYEGGIAILFEWLKEGTVNFPGTEFIKEIEYYGIEFSVNVGTIEIKCLAPFCQKALDLLYEYLVNPEFSEVRFEKLCERTKIEIKHFQDDIDSFALQHIREKIYGDHGYGKNPSGTIETISSLTSQYVKNLFRKYISPSHAYLILGGTFSSEEKSLIRKQFSQWRGMRVDLMKFPSLVLLDRASSESVKILKSQVLLAWAGISVKKYSEEYYHLILADQLFSGSLTNSMYSLLFQIREDTGFFYSIHGSLVSGCGKESGLIMIKGLTSKENACLAKRYIEELIENFSLLFTKEDLRLAKQALLYAMAEKNNTTNSIVYGILQIERYDLSFEKMRENYHYIKKITLSEVKKTVKKYFSLNRMKYFIFHQ
jgi:predicted Zn-dependent peptidase